MEGLAQVVLKLAASMLADVRTYRLPLADGVGEKPRASMLARLMVEEGGMVTTLLHTHVNIEDEQGRKFLQLLDGTRDRQASDRHALAEDSAECFSRYNSEAGGRKSDQFLSNGIAGCIARGMTGISPSASPRRNKAGPTSSSWSDRFGKWPRFLYDFMP